MAIEKCVLMHHVSHRVHLRYQVPNNQVFSEFDVLFNVVQWNLDLRKPDLRKNLDLRKITGKTDFLVHKLFDLRKIF